MSCVLGYGSWWQCSPQTTKPSSFSGLAPTSFSLNSPDQRPPDLNLLVYSSPHIQAQAIGTARPPVAPSPTPLASLQSDHKTSLSSSRHKFLNGPKYQRCSCGTAREHRSCLWAILWQQHWRRRNEENATRHPRDFVGVKRVARDR